MTVHVLPLSAQQPVLTGSFTILGLQDVLPDVVAIGHLTSCCLVEDEREAYLYQLVFRRLTRAALDPAQSLSLIHELPGASSHSANRQH